MAQTRSEALRHGWLSRVVANWRMRRTIRHLLKLDDGGLKDIGLTRTDLHRLLGLGRSVDLAWELERSTLTSGRSRVRG
jgi:uncharacterized protein YjiS (DUF1127 family)